MKFDAVMTVYGLLNVVTDLANVCLLKLELWKLKILMASKRGSVGWGNVARAIESF